MVFSAAIVCCCGSVSIVSRTCSGIIILPSSDVGLGKEPKKYRIETGMLPELLADCAQCEGQ